MMKLRKRESKNKVRKSKVKIKSHQAHKTMINLMNNNSKKKNQSNNKRSQNQKYN